MKIKAAKKAPIFKLNSTSLKLFDSSKLKRGLIIYFYPRDNTPGCTLEAIGFSKFKSKFNKLGCQIFGISIDSVKKHQNFISKHMS